LMRRKGQASVSAVVVFLSALIALGLMATLLPPIVGVLSGFREGLKERGERSSELIRIYIHSTDETENAPPVITIINGWDRESILTDYVVVGWDGKVLASGKFGSIKITTAGESPQSKPTSGLMGGTIDGLRIPAGARIDLTPAHFGLSYSTFAEMAKAVKAIYVRTAEGNSFGSSYGPPPKMTADYQIVIVRATTSSATTSSVVTAPRPSGTSGGGSSTSSTPSGGRGGSDSGTSGGEGGGTNPQPPLPQICEFVISNTGSAQTVCSPNNSSESGSGSGSGRSSGSSSSTDGTSSSSGSSGSGSGAGGSRQLPQPV